MIVNNDRKVIDFFLNDENIWKLSDGNSRINKIIETG